MRKKLCFILITIIFILNLLAIQAFAYSFTTSLSPDSSTVYLSESEVVITVSVSDLDVGDNGLNAFSAYLSYDTDVFETLATDSVEGLNDWSATYSTSTGQVALTKNSFVNNEEEIMQITLTTKSDLDDGTTGTVTLSNIQASNSEDDIDSDSAVVTIEIGTTTTINATTSDDDDDDDSSSSTTPITITASTTTSDDDTNSETTSSYSSDDTTSTTKTNDSSDDDDDIPYTGTASDVILKIIVGIAIIGAILFVKLRKLKDI